MSTSAFADFHYRAFAFADRAVPSIELEPEIDFPSPTLQANRFRQLYRTEPRLSRL